MLVSSSAISANFRRTLPILSQHRRFRRVVLPILARVWPSLGDLGPLFLDFRDFGAILTNSGSFGQVSANSTNSGSTASSSVRIQTILAPIRPILGDFGRFRRDFAHFWANLVNFGRARPTRTLEVNAITIRDHGPSQLGRIHAKLAEFALELTNIDHIYVPISGRSPIDAQKLSSQPDSNSDPWKIELVAARGAIMQIRTRRPTSEKKVGLSPRQAFPTGPTQGCPPELTRTASPRARHEQGA